MLRFRVLAVSAVVSGVIGSVAHADLTADQVWQDWTSSLTDAGYRITSDTTRSGDTLTISDLMVELALTEAEGSASMRLSELRLVENDDGSVSVILPETLPIDFALTGDEAEPITAAVEISHEGLDMRLSGMPDELEYSYSADALVLALTALQGGRDAPEIRAAQIRLEDMTGRSQSALGDTSRAMQQELRAGPVTYDLDVSDPVDGGMLALRGSMAQAEFVGDTSIPESFESADMAAALRAGFRFDSRIAYETGSTAYRIVDGDSLLEGTQSSARGRLSTSMGPEGLRYGGEGDDVTMAVSLSEIPFPVNLGMARMGFDVIMPVIESDAMQQYGIDLELSEFTMSDQLWAMFDPGAQLPRDPATLRLDLSGAGRLLFDLLDPDAIEDLDGRDGLPGEVESLTLNDLTLELAGAKLSGTGAFTFDPTDLESFGGAPAPEGVLDLQLVGGNALLDKLITMGLVPQGQASAVRMMMGLFARPGDGDDELVSKIEVTGDGQILANGQRLR